MRRRRRSGLRRIVRCFMHLVETGGPGNRERNDASTNDLRHDDCRRGACAQRCLHVFAERSGVQRRRGRYCGEPHGGTGIERAWRADRRSEPRSARGGEAILQCRGRARSNVASWRGRRRNRRLRRWGRSKRRSRARPTLRARQLQAVPCRGGRSVLAHSLRECARLRRDRQFRRNHAGRSQCMVDQSASDHAELAADASRIGRRDRLYHEPAHSALSGTAVEACRSWSEFLVGSVVRDVVPWGGGSRLPGGFCQISEACC